MRKHDREPSERRAPPAPSRAVAAQGRQAGSGAPRGRTCPAAPAPSAARPERAGRLPPPWPLRAPALGRPAAARWLTPFPTRARPAAGTSAPTRTFRAAGRAPPAAAAGPEVAHPRPWRFPSSRSPGRPGPPAPEPPALSAAPSPATMVAGKGAGAGAEPGVRATRHHPGVGPPGASPARCCGRCGCRGPRGPERSSCPEGERVTRSPAVTCLAAKQQLLPEELKFEQEPCARPHCLSPASHHRLRLPAGHRR
ncbi:uncharacterized protein LOC142602360 [Balearica regulorum gibbericeps]|uniref:uncharacterized protein LOC142602360 n=1 Tax=Balearica regulorum gibbericeps TaxID=100784 RepID=UPI003F5EF23D